MNGCIVKGQVRLTLSSLLFFLCHTKFPGQALEDALKKALKKLEVTPGEFVAYT
jgi:hypothetical protein